MANPYIIPYRNGQSVLDRRLEDRRGELLSQITDADSDNASIDSSLSKRLKGLYNEVVSEQWRCRRGSFPDPFVAFPEDVWQLIFLEYNISWPYYSLLDLLGVSKLWMNKLICCPILWTTITIDLDEEDLLAKVAIFLQFSQRSKISLQFLAPIRTTPPEVYSILTPHRERIAGLWFHIPTVNRVRKALQVIQRLGDLPSLEWIGSAGSGFTKEDVHQILRYAPCLRRISNLHMRPEDLNSSLTVLPYRITLDTRRDEPSTCNITLARCKPERFRAPRRIGISVPWPRIADYRYYL
ncbi:hypothetical protein FRC20_010386 [Serendipita sp. 405]|nr:hypothetical protein FRC20_010386 [Serendipita sp. 405]